ESRRQGRQLVGGVEPVGVDEGGRQVEGLEGDVVAQLVVARQPRGFRNEAHQHLGELADERFDGPGERAVQRTLTLGDGKCRTGKRISRPLPGTTYVMATTLRAPGGFRTAPPTRPSGRDRATEFLTKWLRVWVVLLVVVTA